MKILFAASTLARCESDLICPSRVALSILPLPKYDSKSFLIRAALGKKPRPERIKVARASDSEISPN